MHRLADTRVSPSCRALVAALALAPASCGARSGLPIPDAQGGSSSSSSSSQTSSATTSATTTSATTTSATTVSSSATGVPMCAPDALFVYVVSQQNDIYRFDPPAKTFNLVWPLTCVVPAGQVPNSMAVDRDGIAWINYNDFQATNPQGSIFRVNLADGMCTPSGISLATEWQLVGMGFAVDPTSATGESLFLTSKVGHLGRVDLNANTVVPVGALGPPLGGNRSELTGAPDGRLFALVDSNPASLVSVDKTNAAVLQVFGLSGLNGPFADFAFSFWGGDFYLYTSTNATGGSSVARYDPTNGSLDPSYVPDAGFSIVGAGVAPCAVVQP